ncbi:hypothetical protein [Planococcus sp. ISL-109]|uniref:hypothetical protein n=1 Tax=Planococcus sp. ISL-109 TaxID=2819166 RepID=UPI001BE858BA|nr:hypothetical protein [Planococcus sp. ISL-109]MBT2583473.1 hypothetical protein [Planococcus sp. ISL-109]
MLNENTAPIEGFFVFSRYSVNIFMLTCGIMLVYAFMGQHVQQGISRKDWYKGTAMAGVGFALLVTLVPLVINGIQYRSSAGLSNLAAPSPLLRQPAGWL